MDCAMLRMTLVLVASIYAALSIWGEPTGDDVTVARADSFAPALTSLRGEAGTTEVANSARPALSEREAVQLALAAGTRPSVDDAPQPAAAETAPEEADDDRLIVYVSGSRVNLRDEPTSRSAIVGTVSIGDRAEVLSDLSDSWVRIRTDRGVEAWIYGRFLSETPA